MPEIPTAERLAVALEQADAPAAMVARAKAGYYDDYRSPLALPITQLVNDARDAGLPGIVWRAMNGDFDATKAESDAWAKSEDGQAAFRDLLKGDD